MTSWRAVTLGDACSRLSSGTGITAKDIAEWGEFPVFGGNGIRGYSSESNFSGECAIIGRQGAYCGNVRYFRGTARMSEHAVVACASQENDTRFLAYLLSTMNLGSFSGQAAQPGLSVKVLAQQQLLLPSLETQRRIGSVLGAIDDLIENNRRRVGLLEEMARTIYREWFVHFRYPGHESVPLVDSPLGPIPEGWDVKTIGEVVKLKYGKALKAGGRVGGEVAVVGSSGIIGWHDTELIPGPSIVVGRKGNVGSIVWLDGSSWPIDTTYFVETHLPLRFVAEQLRRVEFVNSHAAVPGLSREMAYSKEFLVPASEALMSYQELADSLGSQVSVLAKQSDRLVALRDLLLPKLVTGQIDVSTLDLDAVLEESAA